MSTFHRTRPLDPPRESEYKPPCTNSHIWWCLEFPLVPYHKIQALQHEIVHALINKGIKRDVLLILQHFPVLTVGRRGNLDNLLVSERFLSDKGISLIHSERGGDITFHGPGQLIIYPIIDLREAGLSVVEYVARLEEVMIRTVSDWDIVAHRNPLNRGIWVGNCKLGSIGLTIRHGIAFHGLALNVNNSLEPFEWINPCGLRGIKVTSMSALLSQKVHMPEVIKSVKHYIREVFNIEFKTLGDAYLHEFLSFANKQKELAKPE